jgi:GTP-binding protein
MFVDRVRVRLSAGDGGGGVVSFQKRGRYPRGKPVGGSGGPGGGIVLRAEPEMSTLLAYQRNPHHSALKGTHGTGDLRHGKVGPDLVLAVPPGTVVYDDLDLLIADLAEPAQEIRVLEGGRGGRGNAALVSPAHRAPNFCEQGEYGARSWFTFELKLIADAALIGFPNAGKSTFISRVSAAKPKIADYPFTTLEPNLGVVSVGEREFVLADIPGLIEGAAEGKGLGHEFLRHTERARALVVLLDPSPLQTESLDRQYEILMDELTQHDAELAERPRVVVVSKADLGSADDEAIRGIVPDVMIVSAVTGDGLDEVLHAVADAVDEAVRTSDAAEGFVLHRPVSVPFYIDQIDDRWVVTGRAAERAVAFNDLTLVDAANLAAKRLARLGVDDALREAGALPGDDVQIGELVFEFSEPEDD